MRIKFAVLLCLSALLAPLSVEADLSGPSEISMETRECIDCHKGETPVIVQQWGSSKHFRANVGCYECHKAEKEDKDAFEHNGVFISVIASPKDCSRCHEKEVGEFNSSHHSKGARILGSRSEERRAGKEGRSRWSPY